MIPDGMIVNALRKAGWLASDDAGSINLEFNRNLLPQLDPRFLKPKIASSLRQLAEEGHILRLCRPRETQYLGRRLIWQSPTPRFTRTVAVLSSRLGRRLDQRDEWFLTLRAAITKSPARETRFAINSETAAARFVRHATQLFGRDILEVECPNESESIEAWLARVIGSSGKDARNSSFSISPELHPADPKFPASLQTIPIQDRSLVAASDRILVIHATPQGNISSLCDFVLDRSEFDEKLQIAVDPKLMTEQQSRDLMSRGAVGWYLFDDTSCGSVHESTTEPSAPIISLPEGDWHYLTHWTRRQSGSWLDQGEDDYLDELVLGEPSKDRSALAALARIVASRRVIASIGANRCKTPTVSFTQVPLDQWARHRTFRPHRMRWDFEPYGICVDRPWLMERSARPVIYGSAQDEENLPAADKPFFQISRSSNSTQTINWEAEKEWRTIGDIDLEKLPSDAAFIFVPTRREADHIAAISKWPVVVLRI